MKSKKLNFFDLMLFTLIISLFTPTVMADTLYSVTSSDNLLREINPNDATTISSIPMTLVGETINGATGLTTHPVTNQLWVILKASGGSGRLLASVNVATGVVTPIGYTGIKFAGITFNANGSLLYAVSGDGATPSESLFQLNQTTGTPTLLATLGNGDDGESITFNSSDNLIYHVSGHNGSDVIFETIDPNTFAITNIPLAGNALEDEEVQAIVPFNGGFLWKQDHNNPGPLFFVTQAGVPTLIGDMDHQAKGLAFVATTAMPIPTLNQWGLILLIMSMFFVIVFTNHKSRKLLKV